MIRLQTLARAIMVVTAVLALARYTNADPLVLNPAEAPSVIVSPTLGVLTLNLAHARGTAVNQLFVSTDGHRGNLEAAAGLVDRSGAHVVALQEADAPSLWSGSFNHVDYLSRQGAGLAYAQAAHADSWLFAYGTALLAASRIDGVSSTVLPSSWFTPGKGLVRGNIDWRPREDGETVTLTVVSAHFDFSSKRLRRRQAEALVEALRDPGNPLVLAGDFNAEWGEEDSIIRYLCRELNLNAYQPEAADLGTYRGGARLDWILVSHDLDFRDYRVLDHRVSDHRAVLAVIGPRKGM